MLNTAPSVEMYIHVFPMPLLHLFSKIRSVERTHPEREHTMGSFPGFKKIRSTDRVETKKIYTQVIDMNTGMFAPWGEGAAALGAGAAPALGSGGRLVPSIAHSGPQQWTHQLRQTYNMRSGCPSSTCFEKYAPRSEPIQKVDIQWLVF